MGIVFVPVYIHYLGVESYGLIGIFAAMQAWLSLLDLGMSPTLSREMSRFLAGVHSNTSIRNLFNSLECIYLGLALLIGFFVMFSAGWIGSHWLRVEKLPIDTVVSALVIMAWVMAFRWMTALYRGAVIGLQRQVWLNTVTAFFATARGAGVIFVLAFVSSTIEAYFVCQGLLAFMEAGVFAYQLRRWLPSGAVQTRFSMLELKKVWRFAGGVFLISLLAMALTQIDKVLLSRMITLKAFGYYSLAVTISAVLRMVMGPIRHATYPRMTELVAGNQKVELSSFYHMTSQLLSILVIPIAFTISFFAGDILFLWTRDSELVASVSPIVSIYIWGTLLNALVHPAASLQLAYGWISLMIYYGIAAVIVFVPMLFYFVPDYGVIAGAVIWVCLNLFGFSVVIPIMHRRILPGETMRWYVDDVLKPGLVALSVVAAAKMILTEAATGNEIAGSDLSNSESFDT